MNWKISLLVAAAIVVVFFVKRAGQISTKEAAGHLKTGALVIDVRTRGEFNSGHLTNAVNIPLDEITTAVPQRWPDKSQTLLLHCQSGMRSGMAQKKLISLGYTNTFNLGSYSRAESILKQGQ
ncbi:MAG: rhodanese-like domain-containing protein [Verrucomicrobiae bacterium]